MTRQKWCIVQHDEVLKAFTFDATNRMTASMGIVDGIQKNATYAYNGLGHRMEQNIYTGILPENPEKKIQYTIDMTRQYYNLLQTNSGEENAQTYYWDGNVAGMESYGEERFYLQDDLGSPMQLLDVNGMSHETYAFDEFGLGLVDQPRNSQMFGFTGYQMDEVGGLYFAQARRYDAQSGRFVSEDKVRGFVEIPFTMNHYIYCWNDSEDYVDKDGNIPTVLIGAGIGAVAGGLMSIGSDLLAGEKINWSDAGKMAAAGAISGALIGTGVGAGAGAKIAMTAGIASVGVGTINGVSNVANGKNYADGYFMGTVDGALMGMSMTLNPTGAFLGLGSQIVADAITGNVSSTERYASSMVGGAISNPVLGSAVSAGLGDILENASGEVERTIEEILLDMTLSSIFSFGINQFTSKVIPFNLQYYLKVYISKDTSDIIESGMSGVVDGVYNMVLNDINVCKE